MNKARWMVVASIVVLFACGDDADSDQDGPNMDAGAAGAGAGGVSGSSGTSGTGTAGFPMPGGCGANPFGCGMCFECAPGCRDCGLGAGCECIDGGAPVALPWDPPFEAIGEVGYRDSTDPWCSGMMEALSLDVFSDERGVFAIVSGFGSGPQGAAFDDEDAGVPAPSEDVAPNPINGFIDQSQLQPRTELWWNDGRSWKVSVDEINRLGRNELTGVPGSVLMVSGEQFEDPTMSFGPVSGFVVCALGMIDATGLECLDLDPVSSVFVAGPQRAAAVMGGSRLLLYDGERWRGDTVATPFPVTEVWADDNSLLAAGRAGVVLWREGEGWRLEDPGTLAHITSVWGPAREDLWAGTSDGHILHYDGVTWTDVGTLGGETCDLSPPITGIWGSGDDVYVHSATQLVRIRGGELETLANWSCSLNATPSFSPVTGSLAAMSITGLWGNGPNEIFIGIIDSVRAINSQCGAAHVVYYDGERFHRM